MDPAHPLIDARQFMHPNDWEIFDVLVRFQATTCPTCGTPIRRDGISAETFARGHDTPRYAFSMHCPNGHAVISEKTHDPDLEGVGKDLNSFAMATLRTVRDFIATEEGQDMVAQLYCEREILKTDPNAEHSQS